jgi:endonuclease/exonuclease/phosphatase family metal-dependent hydrolase
MSYNAHDAFDAARDGSEYPEFVPGGGWTKALYERKLGALARVISEACGLPDVVCLQEIENARVAADLSAALPDGGYRYVAVAKSAGAATACAVLSRVPILSTRTHALSFGPDPKASSERPALEVEFGLGGDRRAYLIVCHWKSKREGAAETEALRRAQAAAVRARVLDLLAADPEADIAIAGDLNENPDEWELVGRAYPTALMPAAEADRSSLPLAFDPSATRDSGFALYSPWSRGFSYRYGGRDERIDHFLLSRGLFDPKGLRFVSFEAIAAPFLIDADGTPIAWTPRDGQGCSDHLPLLLELAIEP